MENDSLVKLLQQPPRIRDNGFSAQTFERHLLRAKRQNLFFTGLWFCTLLVISLLVPWQSLLHVGQGLMSDIDHAGWLTALPQGQSMVLGVIVLLLVSCVLNLPERDF